MTAKFGFQVKVNEREIWVFPEDVNAAVAVAKAQAAQVKAAAEEATDAAKVEAQKLLEQAKTGIVYGWTRAPGDDPIALGSSVDLMGFIDDSILGALPDELKPDDFSFEDAFTSLIGGLPEPVASAADDLASGAIFELDGMRLKIPGKGSTKELQFELAMMVNLTALDLKLGPFQLRKLYAKLGNFS